MRHSRFLPCIFLTAALLLCGFTAVRNEQTAYSGNVVAAQTPTDTGRGGTLWSRSFSSGKTSYNSNPVLTGQSIYLVNENRLYQLDYQGNITGQTTLSASMDSVCRLLLVDDFLYIPLSGGLVQCVRIPSMETAWTSEPFGGQSLSSLYYHGGALYGGTTHMVDSDTTTGVFYCLDASDGRTIWRYEDTEHPGGYYWSGAVSCGNALFFAGDNGILVSHSLLTDEIYDTEVLTDTAKIRVGLTFDAENDALYTVSNDGVLYKISASEDGTIRNILSAPAVPGSLSVNCTSTPTICNNRLYVGSIADGYGRLSVLDASTLSLHYCVRGEQYAEIKSSPLVSTGYATEDNHHLVYVYVTCNAMPGALFCLADNEEATSGALQTLYTPPASASQFCLSDVVCGQDGTLYYSNDSGSFFAVREIENAPRPTAPAPSRQPINSPPPTASPQKTASPLPSADLKKPKAPVRIRCRRKKNTWVLKWKKKTAGSQTLVYIRCGSGKWRKTIVPKKSRLVITKTKKMRKTLARGKKIQVRLRSRIRQKKKWRLSPYSRICRLR